MLGNVVFGGFVPVWARCSSRGTRQTVLLQTLKLFQSKQVSRTHSNFARSSPSNHAPQPRGPARGSADWYYHSAPLKDLKLSIRTRAVKCELPCSNFACCCRLSPLPLILCTCSRMTSDQNLWMVDSSGRENKINSSPFGLKYGRLNSIFIDQLSLS